MRDLECLEAVGGAAKKAGAGVGRLLGKVSPDVWREFGYVTMLSYSLLLPRREQVVDRGADDYLPVVLVHGLGGNRGAWLPLRVFLRINGHRRIHAFGYEDGTVERHAADLKNFVDAVLRTTGEAQVDVVAHSLGGIIARYAIQRLEMSTAVRALVTLATPHQGTYAARYANTPLTRSLRPESDLLRDLNGDDLTGRPMRFFSIFSDRDVYVVPAERMKHPNAENVFLPDLSHSQFLVSPRVFRIVASCLPRPLAPVQVS
jgi:pimeloyl-ACP methyl ester carboxylesterase